MSQRLVELADADVALDAQLSNGRTGATALVALREADTVNSWLDFNDNTFKTAGWTTRQAALAEVSAGLAPGLYRTTIDITALLPARVSGDRMVAEFDVSATGPNLQVNGIEELALVTEMDDVAAPGAAMDLVTDAVDADAVATSGAQEIRDEILSDSIAFAGANVDAAVSSRSSHSAADVDTTLSGTHGAGSWETATGFAVPGDAMDLVADAVDDAAMAADVDTYQAKVWLIDDNSGGTDRYKVAWFQNGEPVLAGITVPTIRVFQANAAGTVLFAATAMAAVGAEGVLFHDETANRIGDGSGYFALVEATIGSATRTWVQPVGRDSGT